MGELLEDAAQATDTEVLLPQDMNSVLKLEVVADRRKVLRPDCQAPDGSFAPARLVDDHLDSVFVDGVLSGAHLAVRVRSLASLAERSVERVPEIAT